MEAGGAGKQTPRITPCHLYHHLPPHCHAILPLSPPQEAIELDPANPLARYEKASLLMALDRPQEVRAGVGGGGLHS